MLKLAGIHKSCAAGGNKLHVLKGIDLRIGKGEFVWASGAARGTVLPSSSSRPWASPSGAGHLPAELSGGEQQG